MPALQVKDCPADVYDTLRSCAAAENRSISQQTLTILQDYLSRRKEQDRKKDRIALPAPHESQYRNELTTSSIYSSQRDEGNFSERRSKIFKELKEFPSISLPEGYNNTVELCHAAREQRW